MARTPMQWDGSPYAGFSTIEPWLPLSPDGERRDAASLSADPDSILSLYRRLLAIRRNTPALQAGRYQPLEAGSQDVFAYLRAHPTGRCLVALNFTGSPRRLEFPGGESGWVTLSTYLDRAGNEVLDGFELRANEGVVITLAAAEGGGRSSVRKPRAGWRSRPGSGFTGVSGDVVECEAQEPGGGQAWQVFPPGQETFAASAYTPETAEAIRE